MPVASAVTAVATAVVLLAGGSGYDVVLTLRDPALIESSGLAVSARHPGVLWTHNDGGRTAEVVAVDSDGATVAHVTLAGIDPYDAEALAPGNDARGRPALYLGDIGDNLAARPDVSVFRFSEPARLTDATVTSEWYRFSYPDGAHDAEALLVDPNGRIIIATKELVGGALYRAPRRLVTADRGTNRLTRVAGAPALITDGAYLPDGRFVLRSYTSVFVYDRPGHEVARAACRRSRKGSRWPRTTTGCWSAARARSRRCWPCRSPAAPSPQRPGRVRRHRRRGRSRTPMAAGARRPRPCGSGGSSCCSPVSRSLCAAGGEPDGSGRHRLGLP